MAVFLVAVGQDFAIRPRLVPPVWLAPSGPSVFVQRTGACYYHCARAPNPRRAGTPIRFAILPGCEHARHLAITRMLAALTALPTLLKKLRQQINNRPLPPLLCLLCKRDLETVVTGCNAHTCDGFL